MPRRCARVRDVVRRRRRVLLEVVGQLVGQLRQVCLGHRAQLEVGRAQPQVEHRPVGMCHGCAAASTLRLSSSGPSTVAPSSRSHRSTSSRSAWHMTPITSRRRRALDDRLERRQLGRERRHVVDTHGGRTLAHQPLELVGASGRADTAPCGRWPPGRRHGRPAHRCRAAPRPCGHRRHPSPGARRRRAGAARAAPRAAPRRRPRCARGRSPRSRHARS